VNNHGGGEQNNDEYWEKYQIWKDDEKSDVNE